MMGYGRLENNVMMETMFSEMDARNARSTKAILVSMSQTNHQCVLDARHIAHNVRHQQVV